MLDTDIVAAVDLGSNSFRLEIGRVVGAQIYTMDALREPVRLAAGLTKDKYLDHDAQGRAFAALDRFGERLRGFGRHQVRAVATNTFRVARNAKAVLRGAEAHLGFPIEVVGGQEEARLIYFGVAHLLEPGPARRLVVDIGGGSTELIVGTGYQPELMESIYVGCVGYSLRFFPGEVFTKAAFRQAELAARHELEVLSKRYRSAGWADAIGSSGTARSLADVIESNGFADHGITREGLERLKAALIKAESGAALRLAGLKGDRIPVLGGGLAIMLAIFDELGLDRMTVSNGALRTGVLYDLLGRGGHEDMREATIREFMFRYQVDEAQALRVSNTAVALWKSIEAHSPVPLTPPMAELEAAEHILRRAAMLHEIGRSMSHNGYHKHSAYILSNADMPGFSKREQTALATMVLGHTGKLPKIRNLVEHEDDWRLVACLRLAALLHRSRNDLTDDALRMSADGEMYKLAAPRMWLEGNPLTDFDLTQEVEEWRRVGRVLSINAIEP
jgi:exopolyphosphatase / guanosine-5'-triphosphate,3'-diphosphate pyrophosphatase